MSDEPLIPGTEFRPGCKEQAYGEGYLLRFLLAWGCVDLEKMDAVASAQMHHGDHRVAYAALTSAQRDAATGKFDILFCD